MTTHKNVFLFVGAPGSGKGTLASWCTEKLGFIQLSTGNLFRKHIAEKTHIGKEIDFAIKSGKLVPDSLVSQLVDKWLLHTLDTQKFVILDGYPRTLPQAEALEVTFQKMAYPVNVSVCKLTASDDLILDRLQRRFVCSNVDCQKVYSVLPNTNSSLSMSQMCVKCECLLTRRSDDEELAIKKRLSMYHKFERDLLSFYKERGTNIVEINAESTAEDVFVRFRNYFGSGAE